MSDAKPGSLHTERWQPIRLPAHPGVVIPSQMFPSPPGERPIPDVNQNEHHPAFLRHLRNWKRVVQVYERECRNQNITYEQLAHAVLDYRKSTALASRRRLRTSRMFDHGKRRMALLNGMSISPQADRVTVMGQSRELSADQQERLAKTIQLGPAETRYVNLRAAGLSPEAAVREIHRVNGVDRSPEKIEDDAAFLESETEVARMKAMGIDHMTDMQFRAWKNNLLIQIAQHPGPNAGASLRALEVIEQKRFEEKFGTREATERTLKECEERLVELDVMERRAFERGAGDADDVLGSSAPRPESRPREAQPGETSPVSGVTS